MANLTITESNVKVQGKTITTILVQIGETITRGQPLYRQATGDSKYWRADNNVDAATAKVEGISMTGGVADDYVILVTSGPMHIGSTLTKGNSYILSATAGLVADVADLASGNFLTRLGYAIDTTTFQVDINATGVSK